MRRDFAIRFLDRLGPASHVVPQLVWSEVVRVEPPPRLETDDAEASARKRKCGNAADRAEADNDDVGLRQVRGHGEISSSRLALAGLFLENIAYSYADLWVGVSPGSSRCSFALTASRTPG
jgi:hypothetical protein